VEAKVVVRTGTTGDVMMMIGTMRVLAKVEIVTGIKTLRAGTAGKGHRTMQMQLLPRLKDHSVSRIVKDSSVAIVEEAVAMLRIIRRRCRLRHHHPSVKCAARGSMPGSKHRGPRCLNRGSTISLAQCPNDARHIQRPMAMASGWLCPM